MRKVKVLIASIIIWGIIFMLALDLKLSISLSLIMSITPVLMIFLLYKGKKFHSKSFTIVVENLPIGVFGNNKNVKDNDTLEYEFKEKEICLEKSVELVEEDVQPIIVYWTQNGKTYHKTNKCGTLSRSKMIYNGTIEESGKSGYCDKCRYQYVEADEEL